MDFKNLWRVAEQARSQSKLTSADVEFVLDLLPLELKTFPQVNLPKTIQHPAGFSIVGAPVGTFLRSALLLSGKKVLGKRYGGSAFYELVEKDLAFGIMRSHFHHGYPKGTHCCVQCTLAVYPVLAVGAIRYFDCAELATAVRGLIREGGWRFSKPVHPRLTAWSLGQAPA